MEYTQNLKVGNIYFLVGYTAPKVFTGMIFECLLTDQKIPAHAKIKKDTGININDYNGYIFNINRFKSLSL